MLDCATLYIANHAYSEVAGHPNSIICEFDETAFDEIDKWLRSISPAFMKIMKAAAEYFDRDPRASFPHLKGVIAQG